MLQSASKTIVSQTASAILLAFQHYQLPTLDDEIDEEAEIRVLSLVALEEFEDTLAIEKIVRAGTERFWLELESIMLRLGNGPSADHFRCPPHTGAHRNRQKSAGNPQY
jgi:hypothetical protein